MTISLRTRQTSPDGIDRAVGMLELLHAKAFGSKSMGRFVVTRDQMKQMLGVKNLHEGTFLDLQAHALERSELVISELPDDLFGVVAARKAIRWRRVPKAVLADVVNIGDIGMGAEVTNKIAETEEDE
jgi:hypothetical protein